MDYPPVICLPVGYSVSRKPKKHNQVFDSRKQFSFLLADCGKFNEFLDVILAEKITLCQQKEIELTPFADGQKLSFLDGLDLCVIVGNALDNAIEAVEGLPAERRVIHLKLCPVRDMILFRVQNYYRAQPPALQNWPASERRSRPAACGSEAGMDPAPQRGTVGAGALLIC